MPLARPRILVADDHTLIAQLCSDLLSTEFDVVGTVANGHALIQAAGELHPDVIIVDVAMPQLNGLDAGERVKKSHPLVKLVYLTMNSDPEIAAEAFRRGASGYLLKTCATSELLAAVRSVLRGKTYVSSRILRDAVEFPQSHQRGLEGELRLTDRQREVLQLIAEGRLMKEVGSILNMTPRTVAFHKYRIMEVVGAKSTAELVRYAVRNHLVAA